MIIPIKCFTCGTVLANKYGYYCEEVRKIKLGNPSEYKNTVEYLTPQQEIKKTPEAIVLDTLGLTKMCCRRSMLTHVDIN